MSEYLCSIISKPRLQEFSIHELISLSSLFQVNTPHLFSHYNLSYTSNEEYSNYFTPLLSRNPFLVLNLPPDCCSKIASRAVSISRFSYLISSGSSLSDLISNTLASFNSKPEVQQVLSEDSGFEFRFDTYHSKLSQNQKQEIINSFASVPFNGKVDLTSPERRFIVSISENSYFFSLEVARSKVKRANFYSKYNLPDREYLGPTTTDMDLAMLMVNQAQVIENSFILDPFVGTGGILLAASIFKAVCFGGDIDMRVLKGLKVGRSTKGTQADIFTNFRNYGFLAPEIFRCDNSNPCLGKEYFFDAVVCDPPYGVRAGSRKVKQGSSTEVYEGKKVFSDLLDIAARVLKVGGRLVYLLPTERELYDPKALPWHSQLKIVANSENVLSRKISRRLITMVKLSEGQEVSGQENGFYNDIRNTWFRKEMR